MSKTVYIDALEAGIATKGELFSIKEIQKHQTKGGDTYYRLKMQDKTGDIKANIWKDSISACTPEEFEVGNVVLVDYETSLFKGNIQMTIKKMVKAEDYDLHDLVKMTDKNLDKMYDRLLEILGSLKDSDIKRLVLGIAKNEKYLSKIKHSVAAEFVHHDYVGGLLEHILEMIALAEVLIRLYPRANRSIVIAGIFFHDLGKIEELAISETAFVRTVKGYLVGHMMIAINILEHELEPNFPEDKKLALQHIILSHHEKIEFGSPVRPATLEAIIVAMVDKASSTVRQMQKELDEDTPDSAGFGRHQKFLGTRVYHKEYIEEE